MEIQRQSGSNYGTIDRLYIAEASNYTTIMAAYIAAASVWTDQVLSDHFFAVKFPFEMGTWSEKQINGSHGDHFEQTVMVKLSQYNNDIRDFHKFWWHKQQIALVYDHQGNVILVGTDSEPLKYTGSKPSESRITQGSILRVELSRFSRIPL
jgi:hypothetical protein